MKGCRSCGAYQLDPVLSLGRTPLANALLKEDELLKPEPTFPLDLVFCPSCALVQITETVPPEQLFSHYLYMSSFSDTMLQHSEELATTLTRERGLGANSLVIEVASNDGYLLQFYKRAGVPVLGMEPAANVAKVAEERGIPTLVRFFGSELGLELRKEGKRADVIHANNVLAHVADLNGFVAGIALALKDDGVAVIEVPHVKPMIERLEFDTIYHEHLCYYSLTALRPLLERHRLKIVDVHEIPLHGGSLQVHAAYSGEPSARVHKLLEEERNAGIGAREFYRDFGEKVRRLRTELVRFLDELKSDGSRIAAYGASAKGSTLLNYCGIGPRTLEFVADRSTMKQGLYTPGTHLKVMAPEALLETRPDHVLLLTWNFADEILEQQDAYRKQGGKFIIPVPEPVVV
ncbi:MAG TPA: class I SAM-dependent methyltransferase [Candidatus Dormibacteraeota bacterium]|nr:class I SAM-dependent methyltransferase [Candidatus Dormibacteraeota bacterium]